LFPSANAYPPEFRDSYPVSCAKHSDPIGLAGKHGRILLKPTASVSPMGANSVASEAAKAVVLSGSDALIKLPLRRGYPFRLPPRGGSFPRGKEKPPGLALLNLCGLQAALPTDRTTYFTLHDITSAGPDDLDAVARADVHYLKAPIGSRDIVILPPLATPRFLSRCFISLSAASSSGRARCSGYPRISMHAK